jgi:hypothetical protein
MGIYDEPGQYHKDNIEPFVSEINKAAQDKEIKSRLKDDTYPTPPKECNVIWKDGGCKHKAREVTPQELNLMDQEVVLRLKIQQIVTEYGGSIGSSIEMVDGGYKVGIKIQSSCETWFISKELVMNAKLFSDGSVYVNWNGFDMSKANDIFRRWNMVVKGWNEGKMIPGKVATDFTYKRFAAQDKLPIKKL